MLTSSKTENTDFTSSPYSSSAWRGQRIILDISETTEFANWRPWTHPAIDDVFYLACTVFLKTIWVSCQHPNLRKFHIKCVFLVSLLKFWRSTHPGPTFSSSNHTVRPSSSSALTLDVAPFLLPHFPRSPLLSLPLYTGPCGLWVGDPQRERSPKRGYFAFLAAVHGDTVPAGMKFDLLTNKIIIHIPESWM